MGIKTFWQNFLNWAALIETSGHETRDKQFTREIVDLKLSVGQLEVKKGS